MGILLVSHIVLEPRLVVVGFAMLDERGFRQGRVFTAVLMGIIIGLIVCRDVWFVCALTYNALLASKISNHDENFLGGGFVGAG